jgi:hypothetical protein
MGGQAIEPAATARANPRFVVDRPCSAVDRPREIAQNESLLITDWR